MGRDSHCTVPRPRLSLFTDPGFLVSRFLLRHSNSNGTILNQGRAQAVMTYAPSSLPHNLQGEIKMPNGPGSPSQVRYPTRRRFLKSVALAGLGAGLAGEGASCGVSRSSDSGAPLVGIARGKILVRKDIEKATPNEIAVLKHAIEVMKKESKNPRAGWRGQANIHQVSCPHGNWFFLPWHRAYLYYFEKICRKASGDDAFTLPYWNWTKSPTIPQAFWDEPFSDGTRKAAKQDKAKDEFVGKEIVDRILAINDFETFAGGATKELQPEKQPGQGRLESSPHNHIHNFVGGNMRTFMSPLDPLFWLHHANVDRLWTTWVTAHPKSMPAAKTWLELPLDFFDFEGNPTSMKVQETLNTHDLGYRYDTQAETTAGEQRPSGDGVGHESVSEEFRASSKISDALRVGTAAIIDLFPSGKLREHLGFLANAPLQSLKESEIRVTIRGIRPPEGSDLDVRVFVNCPSVTRDTPVSDAHFIGSFSFFPTGSSEEHGHRGRSLTSVFLDGLKTFRALRERKLYDPQGPLQVQLIALNSDRESIGTGQLIAEQVELDYLSGRT